MNDRTRALIGLAMFFSLVDGHAQELLTTDDGVSLYGTVRLVGRGAATCNVLPEHHSAELYEQMRAHQGQPLDIWELEYSVYNGTGRALDHLIAYYQVDSPHPPCTNWDEHWEAGDYPLPVDWFGPGGRIQRTGAATPTLPNETIAETMLVLVFRGERPHFADWSVNYTFADVGSGIPTETQHAQALPSQPEAAGEPSEPADDNHDSVAGGCVVQGADPALGFNETDFVWVGGVAEDSQALADLMNEQYPAVSANVPESISTYNRCKTTVWDR